MVAITIKAYKRQLSYALKHLNPPEDLWSCAIAAEKQKFGQKLFNQPSCCFLIIWCVINASVTSWGVLVIWEEKVWIHPLSCRRSWGHWNTSKRPHIHIILENQTSFVPLVWSLSLIHTVPALLHHLHPVHAGHRVLHWKHVEDLCFLNTTQDHLLGVSEAESQYWGLKRE